MSTPIITDVLVIGGSLVGLSAAMFLGQHHVKTICIEQHSGSMLHPRAIGYTPRTMEIYDAIPNLVCHIPQAPPNFRLRRINVEKFVDRETWGQETQWTPQQKEQQQQQQKQKQQQQPSENKETKDHAKSAGPWGGNPASPYYGAAIAQDVLEPLLRDKVRDYGIDLRLNTRYLGLKQTHDYVLVDVQDLTTQQSYSIQASYVIAADGNHSPIRESLGIKRSGVGYIRTVFSCLFSCPEFSEYTKTGYTQFDIHQPEHNLKAFMTTYDDGRWVVFIDQETYDKYEMNTMTSQQQQQIWMSIVHQVCGINDSNKDQYNIHIITTGQWDMNGLIADTFISDRIILAGDAAHALPPNRGGYGANTGIDDVHNLSWKLASILSGLSSSKLLHTYQQERSPIAWLRHEQIFMRPDYQKHIQDKAISYEPHQTIPYAHILNDDAMEFGQLYQSNGILVESGDQPASGILLPAQSPAAWCGFPGTRAPHIWLTRQHYHPRNTHFNVTMITHEPYPHHDQLSLLHLFYYEWIVLTVDNKWMKAVTNIKNTHPKLPIQAILIHDTDATEFLNAYGITSTGVSLVRPDGYIAWRKRETNDKHSDMLIHVMKQVLHMVE